MATGKRVLVTGAAGFIGSVLVRRLLRDGHEVHVLLRPDGTDPWRLAEIAEDVELHSADLRDADEVRSAIAGTRPEWVFHLAAYGAYSWEVERSRIVETNLLGTVHALDACRESRVEAFVNAGSSSEYGFKDHPPSESELPEPNSDYAVAKAAATLYSEYVGRTSDSRVSTLRLYSAYGPFEDPNRLIPTLVVRGLSRELPPLVNPAVARDFVYVDDVVEAFLLAAQKARSGGVYNIGTGVQTTIAEAVEVTRRLFGIEAEPQWGSMEDRSWDTNIWVADNQLAYSELGWEPRHSFEEGLQRTAGWFRERPDLMEIYGSKDAVAARRGMPP